jgi:RNA polymerase sigma-70 factor (ECF subfamily)
MTLQAARVREEGRHALMATYLGQRQALVRFFTARLGSAAAGEDLVQEIYLKLLGVRTDVPIENGLGYIYRLGWNLMLDMRRGERRSALREANWAGVRLVRIGGEPIVDEPPAESALDTRRRLERILSAVDELPPSVQRAFRLHKLEEMSHSEVAQAMGISRSAVEKHVSAALRHLLFRLRA